VRSILRSALRVLLATLASLVLLLGLAAAAITQPTFGTAPAGDGGPRADPRLRGHVEFLTTAVSPRDAGHPENLDRTAAYLRDHFSKTGARVREQTFEVRGRTYRNVIASFGPEQGPVLIVGAHYDSFGEFGANPGADDNASGVAAVIEVARALAQRAGALRRDV